MDLAGTPSVMALTSAVTGSETDTHSVERALIPASQLQSWPVWGCAPSPAGSLYCRLWWGQAGDRQLVAQIIWSPRAGVFCRVSPCSETTGASTVPFPPATLLTLVPRSLTPSKVATPYLPQPCPRAGATIPAAPQHSALAHFVFFGTCCTQRTTWRAAFLLAVRSQG